MEEIIVSYHETLLFRLLTCASQFRNLEFFHELPSHSQFCILFIPWPGADVRERTDSYLRAALENLSARDENRRLKRSVGFSL